MTLNILSDIIQVLSGVLRRMQKEIFMTKEYVIEKLNVATKECIKCIKESKKWQKDYEKYGTQSWADAYQKCIDKAVSSFCQLEKILQTYGGELSRGEYKRVIKKKEACINKCVSMFAKYGLMSLLQD